MKRRMPTFVDRIKRGWKTGLAVLLPVIAVTSWVTSSIGLSGWLVFVVGTFVSLAVAIIAALVHGKLVYIPPIIVDVIGCDGEYTCDYAMPQRLSEACELSRPYYGSEYVNATVVEQWRLKNSTAFVQIVNAENQLCACFGIVGLADSAFEEFIRGRIMDTEFDSRDILNTETTRTADRLYISGVVVREPEIMRGQRRALVMFWCMLSYYKREFGVRKQRAIYALAVSDAGENILKVTGFQIASRAQERRDKKNLYKLVMTRHKWNDLAGKFGDWRNSFGRCYQPTDGEMKQVR